MDAMGLKISRVRSGITQYALAAELGINPSALSQMETGRRPIPTDIAEKINTILPNTDSGSTR